MGTVDCSCWCGTYGRNLDRPYHAGWDSRISLGRWYSRGALVRLSAPFVTNRENTVEVAPLFNQIKDIRARIDVLRGYL